MSGELHFKNRRFYPWTYLALVVGVLNLYFAWQDWGQFRAFEGTPGKVFDSLAALVIFLVIGVELFATPFAASSEGVSFPMGGQKRTLYAWESILEFECRAGSWKKLKLRFKVGKYSWREHTVFEDEFRQLAPLIEQMVPTEKWIGETAAVFSKARA